MTTLTISPQSAYYRRNKDKINRKRREKYATDVDYKTHAIMKARRQTIRIREQKLKEKLNEMEMRS